MTECVALLIIVDARLIVLVWKLIEYCMTHWTSPNGTFEATIEYGWHRLR